MKTSRHSTRNEACTTIPSVAQNGNSRTGAKQEILALAIYGEEDARGVIGGTRSSFQTGRQADERSSMLGPQGGDSPGVSMNRRVSIVLLTSLLMPIGVLEVRAQPLPVFVAVVDDPQPPPLKPEQHAAAIDAAQNRMFAIAGELRKQHGNRQQDWPPDAIDAVYAAENVYKMAMARRDYQPANTRLGLDTVVTDLVTELGKSKLMTPAATRDGAALVFEVIGRRTAQTTGVTDAKYFIRLRIRPGPAMTEARLREASTTYRWGPDFLTKAFVRPTVAASYWDVEIGSPAAFKTAAAVARNVLEGFVKGTALSAAR